MLWTEITLTVPDSLKDAVSGELCELGAGGIWENEVEAPEQTRLVAYFEQLDFDSVRQALELLFQRENLASADVGIPFHTGPGLERKVEKVLDQLSVRKALLCYSQLVRIGVSCG